jgi:hypothetical protein
MQLLRSEAAVKRFISSVIFVVVGAGVANAEPGDYRNGYEDGYNDCIAGGVDAPPRDGRAYGRGYADGYRACTLGPQGTQDAPGPPTAPVRIDAAGWSTLGDRTLTAPSDKLVVGASAGRFSHVRVQVLHGAPQISSIDVRFLDSSLQTIPVGRQMRPGEVLELPLGVARPIASITVSGAPDPGATVQVSAR